MLIERNIITSADVLVDLGSVAGQTKGPTGCKQDNVGLLPQMGISDD